jgi:poly(A) polymerase
MLSAVAGIDRLLKISAPKQSKRALYSLGEEAYRDAVSLAFAWGEGNPEEARWSNLVALPSAWQPPVFPLGGRDVIALSSVRGAVVGTVLKQLEAWWIENDFAPGEDDLRNHLQQMISAAQ